MQILPMRDLKDTVKIENICKETKNPVFITKNGYGCLVVMDMECFEGFVDKIYESIIVNQGLDDYKNGKNVFGFIVGLIMKNTGGKANPVVTSKVLKEELEK